ncbi:MAG TPA: 3-methyl-2-oxobutanoate hydroxymethyltransferase [Pyrinomonadaceae bacterium]|jgi:3-methyl-2-oxobutanoate hydroxymethyltransferase|nr:3-methyl-2-oxobutanoate hydroxymethyltransferase [Pyrinomonadaceae bacterium]
MAYLQPDRIEKVFAPSLIAAKARGEKLVCLTAYDYPTARVIDEAGVDIILVGDSAGNVVFGYGNTVPVTLEEMIHTVRTVKRGVQRALIVADMPYGTYHVNKDETVRNALKLVKEAGAEAVKLEGGENRVDIVKRLVDEEIPVMGHIGLMPQSINRLGNYRVQGKTFETAQKIIDEAKMLEDAGAFSIVLELVPREIAEIITKSVQIPTIGIGAGAGCDIQVLVLHDLLGLSFGKLPRFVRPYANLRETMTDAITRWAEDVRNGVYPSDKESYGLPEETAKELKLSSSETKKESPVE